METKNNDSEILKDFEDAMIDLCTEDSLDEIDLNAKDIKSELIRHEKERSKSYLKSIEKARVAIITKHSGFPEAELLNQSHGLTGEPKVGIFIHKGMDEGLEYMLRKGSFIPEKYQNKLRVLIDYQEPSIWEKKHIACRAGAQVYGFNKGEFNVTHIRKKMIDNEVLYKLLELNELKSLGKKSRNLKKHEKTSDGDGRSLDDVIRVINPYPIKRGRPAKNREKTQGKIVLIPGVFNPKTSKINFQKYSFSIFALTKVLAVQGNSCDQIISHSIIMEYKKILPWTFEGIVNSWIKYAFEKNCRLFDL